jgi:hypothetical protein
MSEKEEFFTKHYIPILKTLKPDAKGKWGKLSAQGMVEHMTDSIGIAWGRIKLPLHTPEPLVPKFKEFALSDKEFKPETKNALMNEEPDPLRNTDLYASIDELAKEIQEFVDYHKAHPNEKILNPFFGELDYKEWLHLLHKHAIHHLKQFDIVPPKLTGTANV